MTAIATHLLCLPGGARLTARRIRPDDKPALARFFDRLSDESRRRRFLAPKPKLTTRDLAFFTEIDHDRHVALVALDRDGAIVAVARYAAWHGRRDRAEIAFAVADDWHGRGLGSALAGRLVEHARRSGLDRAHGLHAERERRLARAPAPPRLRAAPGVSSGVAEYELAFGAALPAAA